MGRVGRLGDNLGVYALEFGGSMGFSFGLESDDWEVISQPGAL